jgi:hypothetical protein
MDRVKNDARDAERLARLLAAGELAFVRVPSLEEEQLRDLVTAREDLCGDLGRARQRLSHFSGRRALRFPGLGELDPAHRTWLRALRFEDRASEVTCADYLAAVAAIEQRPRHGRAGARGARAGQPVGRDDRPSALLSRHRHRDRDGALRRGGQLRPLLASAPAGRLPRARALRKHLRRQASPGRHRQGAPNTRAGFRSRRPSTPGARRECPSSCAGARHTRTPASARSPGTPSGAFSASGTSSPPSGAARQRGHDGLRVRARDVRLGGGDARLIPRRRAQAQRMAGRALVKSALTLLKRAWIAQRRSRDGKVARSLRNHAPRVPTVSSSVREPSHQRPVVMTGREFESPRRLCRRGAKFSLTPSPPPQDLRPLRSSRPFVTLTAGSHVSPAVPRCTGIRQANGREP